MANLLILVKSRQIELRDACRANPDGLETAIRVVGLIQADLDQLRRAELAEVGPGRRRRGRGARRLVTADVGELRADAPEVGLVRV